MSIEDVEIIVITAKDGGATPIDPPYVVKFKKWPGDSPEDHVERRRSFATTNVGRDPVFTVSSYLDWLDGARPDPAVIYGRVSPGWNECLADPDWFPDDMLLDWVRFDPGFSREERVEASKLITNDLDFGKGLSMVRAKLVYDVYPLRSGAAAMFVHWGDPDVPIVKRYGSAEEALAAHKAAESYEDDEVYGDIRLAAEIENEALGWGPDSQPAAQPEDCDDDDYSPR